MTGKFPIIPEPWIFVFGSNTSGRHGAGAARDAVLDYGAKEGVGVGLQGRSYAIPTRTIVPGKGLTTLPLEVVESYVVEFLQFARAHPEMKFWLTPVGCGFAGYKPAQMACLFRDAPPNVRFPAEWAMYLSPGADFY